MDPLFNYDSIIIFSFGPINLQILKQLYKPKPVPLGFN